MKKELYLEVISNTTPTVGALMTYECEVQRSKWLPTVKIISCRN